MTKQFPWKLLMIAAATMFLLMLWVGLFYLRSGHRVGAGIAFLLAALSPASVLMALLSARALARRRTGDTISLDADPETAFRWTVEALKLVAQDTDPEVDRERLTVSVVTARSWKSMGECIVAGVRAEGAGSVIEIKSTSKWPQLVDYGKNRANVQSVLSRLAASRNFRLP